MVLDHRTGTTPIPGASYRDVVRQGHDAVGLWDLSVAVALGGGWLLGCRVGGLPLLSVAAHVEGPHARRGG